jgi:hypothetical protein
MNFEYKRIVFLLIAVFVVVIVGYFVHIKMGIKYTIDGIFYGSIFGLYVSIVESLFNLLVLKRKSEIKYNFKEMSILSALIVVGVIFIHIINPIVFNLENILGFISATAISYLPVRIVFLMYHVKIKTKTRA